MQGPREAAGSRMRPDHAHKKRTVRRRALLTQAVPFVAIGDTIGSTSWLT